jgi:hypothetical protein
MVTVKTLDEMLVVGWKVEKIPPARGWQGSSKEDWVTEWFWGLISSVLGERKDGEKGMEMYLCEESEFDVVPNIGCDRAGRELELAAISDGYGDRNSLRQCY